MWSEYFSRRSLSTVRHITQNAQTTSWFLLPLCGKCLECKPRKSARLAKKAIMIWYTTVALIKCQTYIDWNG